jgi:hypothetical protein
MDIPADTAISETGLGQFEINMMHCDDALRAADDAWLFKMLVKGLARRHGFAASFMAKPYPGIFRQRAAHPFQPDRRKGRNVFDNGGPEGHVPAAPCDCGLPARHARQRAGFCPPCQQLRASGARCACPDGHLLGL